MLKKSNVFNNTQNGNILNHSFYSFLSNGHLGSSSSSSSLYFFLIGSKERKKKLISLILLVFGTKLEYPFCSDIHSSIKIHSFTPKGSI
ncbi:hypothetical protein DERF_004865 [Dermatophagoides farinae]|uniref:Uncharacterized protein n=1 Tax=Dermatophagoides farinae TaxID=6954 RepID=A0A922I463_DERFA|nr:hypothetical protein DERF_004865 [Dermatophagoides farinae]